MEIRQFLIKVAERRNCPRACLNLVDEKECFPKQYFLIQKNFQIGTDPSGIQITIKNAMPAPITFKIHKRNIIEAIFPKLPYRIGLPDLPRPAKNKRFTATAFFPSF